MVGLLAKDSERLVDVLRCVGHSQEVISMGRGFQTKTHLTFQPSSGPSHCCYYFFSFSSHLFNLNPQKNLSYFEAA